MQMLRDLIEFPVVTDKVIWEARQVLRDMGEKPKPHILLRIKLSGTYFEQRALEPYVSVGKVRSLFVEISEDGLTASAYFDKPLPTEGMIEFGYGNEAMFRLKSPFDPDNVRVLDPKFLRKKNVMFLERFFPDRG
ncbi:MAG TPA: hypothetical protein ENJ35_10990 [Gammaproteobacteria bacterium]|nr:hypothetical protein [Gammaproteobacteria bacterium]